MLKKNDRNENKIILGDLILLWIKWTSMVETKHKDFTDPVPVILSLLEKGLKIYGEGRTQILLSSAAMIGSLARIQDRQGLYWYNNC